MLALTLGKGNPMIVGGLKLTHSGGLALVEDGRLIFNLEVQKQDNSPRYSPVSDLEVIPRMLAEFGYEVSDVDHWAIDGWDGPTNHVLTLLDHSNPINVTVAPYRETDTVPSLVEPGYVGQIPLGGQTVTYSSFVHMSSHFGAAYCSSPFARDNEESFVMVWDGGCFPRLYYVTREGQVENGGEVFPLIGHSYAMAAQHFGPWRRASGDQSKVVDDLSVAGKMMAYIAMGTPKDEIQEIIRGTFLRHFEADTPSVADYRRQVIGCGSNGEPSHRYVHAYLTEIRDQVERIGASEDDVLASMHQFVEEFLVERLTAKIRAWKGEGPWNLAFAGGCALNIKWNSALRAHPMFKCVWVPPFPDDSGSAIGTACTQFAHVKGLSGIEWEARLGPELRRSPHVPVGWSASPCRPEELARILHQTGKPAVLLRGRAELGPRALGGRSIIAPAVDPAMKDLLNRAKKREPYRPVAPICLVEHAPEIFDPGTPDPYMLFDHLVRPEWVDRVPAIMHLDGTARLQTVSRADDPVLATILREYHKWSGIPVLCNTSANFNGYGFFPDAASAMEWGQIDLVWSEGVLYRKIGGPQD
ncbi:carbamoyltransferase N-terminal domain-containing protein [Nonomuraea purpurea]|uniref:Carbamoyltransferase N-terminal domain-containing protein n=1 Tax=Nonomuraea purpurea TaxID=1849276 RepID=A0ABV8G2I7_9ACTN